jgi:hypothetical protein
MNKEPAQRYCFVQDNDSHWHLIPADKKDGFNAWLEHEQKLWGETRSEEEFEKVKNEYKGEDFNDYRIGGGIEGYTFENPLAS